MSDETWADAILAESSLPADEFTWTDGSNYGMDGFHFDQTMGEGVKQRARLPEVKGISGLPDGIVTDPDPDKVAFYDEISLVDEIDGVNLGAFIEETAIEKTASLADLDWLDPTRSQDPDRLPVQPTDKGITMLEEAWGVDRRTTGINLVPNRDRETVEYEQSLDEGPKSTLPQDKQAREQIKRAAHWAMRQSAAGMAPEQIKRELVARLGHQAKALRGVVARIEDEHGLAGNVFVHSVAYPGVHRAKTAKEWKKHLRGLKARYVIVPEGEERLAAWEAAGKLPVTEVPWKKALAHYRPRLRAEGYRVASSGDSRNVLRVAFLGGVQEDTPNLGVRPKDIRPAERVSVLEAVRQFRTAEAVPRQAINLAGREEENRRKQALVQIAKWVKAGHLSNTDAHRLARSTVDPRMVLRTAAMLVKASLSPEAQDYQGTGTHYRTKQASVTKAAAWRRLEAAEAEADKQAREFEAGQMGKVAGELKSMLAKGLLTADEVERLMTSGKTASEIRELAAAAARQDHLRPKKLKATEEREYEGALVTRASQQTREAKDFSPKDKRILSAAKKSGIKAGEFRSLLKWARIRMSEGVAGDEFNTMLRLRFSKPLRKAAKTLLREARDEHEGLSGFLYVDAGAYATSRGTKGCEKGALRHRSNGLKYVLAMDRCATCTFNNANDACSKYKKALVHQPPVEDASVYQREAIKMADAPDHEATASLFAPSFDQGEFALTDPLQEISLKEAATPEELGEFLFGGMEL
jgi:hypothetical protein